MAAGYVGIHGLATSDGDLRKQVEVAICVHAAAILANAEAKPEQLVWASRAFAERETIAANLMWQLCAHDDFLKAAKPQATADATVQAAVDAICERY